jgi:GNAT superfamily N-acetyltransferase
MDANQGTKNQNNIKIRRMIESDLPLVNDVDISITGKGRVTSWPFSFEIYWKIYGTSIIGFVAQDNERVAGFLTGYIKQEERSKLLFALPRKENYANPDSKIGWIEMMGVRPEYWHKGIGTLLIEAFEEECKKNQAMPRIVIKHDDLELRKFFQSIGYKPPEFYTLEKKI